MIEGHGSFTCLKIDRSFNSVDQSTLLREGFFDKSAAVAALLIN